MCREEFRNQESHNDTLLSICPTSHHLGLHFLVPDSFSFMAFVQSLSAPFNIQNILEEFHQLPTKLMKQHFLMFDSEPEDQQPLPAPSSPCIGRDIEQLPHEHVLQPIAPSSSQLPL